ncbi:hypothetical protein U1Q18_033486 [Sarracenia purpurea var. burkii]
MIVINAWRFGYQEREGGGIGEAVGLTRGVFYDITRCRPSPSSSSSSPLSPPPPSDHACTIKALPSLPLTRLSLRPFPRYLLPPRPPLLRVIWLGHLIEQVDYFVSQTKTIAGHNLDPTPWHIFPPRNFSEENRYSIASRIIQCSYLSCGGITGNDDDDDDDVRPQNQSQLSHQPQKCPELFRWIHQDLEPWARSGISLAHVMEAKKYAAFRVVIVGGKLYADFYFDCVQSRAMFTVWGLLQLLRRYPGRVPDVDLMFDCMDKPTIDREEHQSMPLPLFRYCTTSNHFDIPFPDWSFWGW